MYQTLSTKHTRQETKSSICHPDKFFVMYQNQTEVGQLKSSTMTAYLHCMPGQLGLKGMKLAGNHLCLTLSDRVQLWLCVYTYTKQCNHHHTQKAVIYERATPTTDCRTKTWWQAWREGCYKNTYHTQSQTILYFSLILAAHWSVGSV